MSQQENQPLSADSPFNLTNIAAYQQWRSGRLDCQRPGIVELLVRVADPYNLSSDEKMALIACCNKYNMAIYQLEDLTMQGKSLVHELGRQLGMKRLDANLRSDEDSVSSLQVREQQGNMYIPYTNKALSWHTDGYYNPLDKQIFGIIMHCVRPAIDGGVNSLINPEDVYIALRDENPSYIEALMHPQAMIIPDNVEAGKVIRAAQDGPVFRVKADGRLHMRFSARKRNIVWRDDRNTHKAVEIINSYLADDKNGLKVKLEAGQGIICNNVLHNRTGFEDSAGQKRLMYRARYYDAVESFKL